MKIYLLLLLFIVFIVFAIAIYYYYYLRVKLFKDLKYICNSLTRNISFNKSSIADILKSTSSRTSTITKYIIGKPHLIYRFVKKDMGDFILNFWESLGKGDTSYEVSNISFYEKEFESMGKDAREELEKKGKVYFKLLLGLGLIICIILL